jgi:hypothetical protein
MSVKSPVSTPLTVSLKVTVQRTVAAEVGLASARTIDVTVGGVASAATTTGALGALVAVQDRNTAVTEYVYVPAATPVSSQVSVAGGSGAATELPQARVVDAPIVRRTTHPSGAPPFGAVTEDQATRTTPVIASGAAVTEPGADRVPTDASAVPRPGPPQ